MKTLLTTLSLCLFFSIHSHAQEWAPVGAKWYYETYVWSPFWGVGYSAIEVTGETEVNGIPVKVLEGKCGCAESPLYTYEEQGKVYLYVKALQEFRLYYDFNLSTGDTLITFDDALLQEVPLLIDSVSFLDWNGDIRKVQHIQYLEPGYSEWGDRIIEGIGSNRCLNFIFPTCDPVGGYIRCFEDPNDGVLTLDPSVPSCTYTPVKDNEPTALGWEASPNPVSSELNITIRQPTALPIHLRLLNQLGQTVGERPLPPFTKRVGWDVESLPPGLYFIAIQVEGKGTEIRKVMKN
ncbi:MAG: T9SS type A sorting domain-containing protein [Lewinellaceae bacterium]|nr:T9SS type A sorting domain-containing protein [Phaeodactylibacter sp.]MCB0613111.1 T9SS type A sorting domain-containing protein [Phaeodactylibacter sp.]MCB9350464.1 T9SS type A sorting domain-containing protein [Lewinellaceae bacterium]